MVKGIKNFNELHFSLNKICLHYEMLLMRYVPFYCEELFFCNQANVR